MATKAKGGKVVQLFPGFQRPMPPAAMLEEGADDTFIPSSDLAQWVKHVLIDEEGPVHNEEHRHLIDAKIGFLWTNVPNGNKGRRILGTAQPGKPAGSGWGAARSEYQIREWFGEVPDFLITLDANYCASCSDAEFLALVDHECTHCAQATDSFGFPKFKKNGEPVFAMRSHDIEEFVSIVRRYGANATHTSAMIEAANKGPEIAAVNIAQACGTCQARRAA